MENSVIDVWPGNWSSSDSDESGYSDDSISSPKMEATHILGETILLPQEMCERSDLFKEILSLDTWKSFTEEQKQHLKAFLPDFPENDSKEKEASVELLMSRENVRFGNSLVTFQNDLKAGYFRPDVSKMRSLLRKTRYSDYKREERWRMFKLVKSVLVSRQRLADAVLNGERPRPYLLPFRKKKSHYTSVKSRYFQELALIREKLGESSHSSEDENFPEGASLSLVKRNRRKDYLVGEMSSSNAVLGSGSVGPSPWDVGKQPTGNPYSTAHLPYSQILSTHAARRHHKKIHPGLYTEDITMDEVSQRCRLLKRPPLNSKSSFSKKHKTKSEECDLEQTNCADSLTVIKQEPDDDGEKVDVEGVDELPDIKPSFPSVNSIPSVKPSVKNCNLGILSRKLKSEEPPNRKLSLESMLDNGLSGGAAPRRVRAESSDSHFRQERKADVRTIREPLKKQDQVKNPKQEPLKVVTKQEVVQTEPEVEERSRQEETLPLPSFKRLKSETSEYVARVKEEQARPPVPSPPQPTPPTTTSHQHYSLPTVKSSTRILTPATLSDLDGIDMMALPVDFDESSLDDLKSKPELMEETQACFFSLIRDIITSTLDHRIEYVELEARLNAWASSPIAPLNHWYTPAIEQNLMSALLFLTGESTDIVPEEYVPYMEYKLVCNAYQWIGAGRDSDQRLVSLCAIWVERGADGAHQQRPIGVRVDGAGGKELVLAGRPLTQPPPPHTDVVTPRGPAVQPTSPNDRHHFRIQEKQRYENPDKSFTYTVGSREATLGPVRSGGVSASATKARGHSLLVATRPNCVTILELVRDAVARLPNGQGTRADIVTLLKDSQYLQEEAAESVLSSVVSGALDRLHSEHDPSVKYDPKRKIWVYLHAGRSAHEFERLHALGIEAKPARPKPSRKSAKAKKDGGQAGKEDQGGGSEKERVVSGGKGGGTKVVAGSKAKGKAAGGSPVKRREEPMRASLLHSVSTSSPSSLVSSSLTTTLSSSTPSTTPTIKKTLPLSSANEGNKQAKPIVKVIATSQNSPSQVRTVGKQQQGMSQQQVLQLKQQLLVESSQVKKGLAGGNSCINSQGQQAGTTSQQQMIVMKQTGDGSGTGQQQQMIVISSGSGQQQFVLEPQLSVKQHKQIQQLLAKQQSSSQQQSGQQPDQQQRTPASTLALQQQLQQLILAKQQQMLAEQQKAGVKSSGQQMIVVKQGTNSQGSNSEGVKGGGSQGSASVGQGVQQMILVKQGSQQSQPSGDVQQMILVKQAGASGSQGELQQISQQQLQQLLLKQQQQTPQSSDELSNHQGLQHLLLKQQQTTNSSSDVQQISQQQLQQLLLKQQSNSLTQSQDVQQITQQQLQQLLLKQQTVSSQGQSDVQQISQSQLQQLLLKQSGNTSQDVSQISQQQLQQLLMKQQQQSSSGQDVHQISQQQLQLLLKQQQQMAPPSQGDVQQISQQQLQQLILKQQQQQQMIIVKQHDQKQIQVITSQQPKSQTLTLAQIQQLQQQQLQQKSTVTTSLLSNPKVVASRVQSSVSRSPLSQYAVVSLPQQQRVGGGGGSGVVNVVTSAECKQNVVASGSGSGPSGTTVASASRLPTAINMAHLSSKQVLLAGKPHGQNVLLGTTSSGQAVLVAGGSGGSSGSPGGLAVIQQGSQQILIPSNTLKTLQGLKVIPITTTTRQAQGGVRGGGQQQVFARLVSPARSLVVQSHQHQQDSHHQNTNNE